MCKVDTLSLSSTVDLIKLRPLLILKFCLAQELVEEIPAILFIGVMVVDCERRLVVDGLRTMLSLEWACITRTCTTFALFQTMSGAQGPWSSSIFSVPEMRACV